MRIKLWVPVLVVIFVCTVCAMIFLSGREGPSAPLPASEPIAGNIPVEAPAALTGLPAIATVEDPVVSELPGLLAGRLYSPSGEPLAGEALRVVALSTGRAPAIQAEQILDGEGRFAARLNFGKYKAILESGELFAEHRFELSPRHPAAYWTEAVGAAGWIFGRVFGPEGQGVAGVHIVPTAEHSGITYQRLQLTGDAAAVSEEAGAFRIRIATAAPHLWRLAAVVQGAVATISAPVVPGTDNVILRLPGETTLHGTVWDLVAGEPVPGLVLAIESRPFYVDAKEVRTGHDGSFTLTVPQVNYSIAAVDKALVLMGDTEVDLRGSVDTEVMLFCSAGSVVEGNVMNVAGTPFAGAEVRASVQALTKSAPTTSDGFYRLEGLGAGEYRLEARLDAGRLARPLTLSVGAKPEILRQDFVIDCSSIHGRVVSPSGEPQANAKVWARNSDSHLSVSTDVDGAFEFPCVQGQEIFFEVSANGRESGELGPYYVADTATEGIELVLDYAWDGFVAGRVVDAGGRGLAFAKVALIPDGEQMDPLFASVDTDAAGHFSLVAATPASYELRVYPQIAGVGTIVASACSWALALGSGERMAGLVVECDYPRGQIEGAVTDQSGRPINMARVDAMGVGSSGAATTGMDGRFVIAGLEKIPFTVAATHSRFASAVRYDVTPDAKDLRLVLENKPMVLVNATDRLTGKPLPQFSVVFVSRQLQSVIGPVNGASPDGILEIEIEPGRTKDIWAIEVQSAGYERYHAEVHLELESGSREFHVALAKAYRVLRGVVQDSTGQPMPGAALFLDAMPEPAPMTRSVDNTTTPGEGPPPDAVAGADGKFEFELSGDAIRTVFASLDGYAPGSASGRPGAASDPPLVIQLQPAGSLRVAVVKHGEPVVGARLWLAPHGLTGRTLPADGTMTWPTVAAGPAILDVAESGQSETIATSVEVEVRPETLTEVTVDLP
ncbi:MAG: carboxypeptidase regulatory-like domain-containing protein [Candidatus Hydrogenedentes bacterium]|nr:carboxypeptidase regulatory-like domain-containing protein [Candidatus Hydrogenedentota bacterium]